MKISSRHTIFIATALLSLTVRPSFASATSTIDSPTTFFNTQALSLGVIDFISSYAPSSSLIRHAIGVLVLTGASLQGQGIDPMHPVSPPSSEVSTLQDPADLKPKLVRFIADFADDKALTAQQRVAVIAFQNLLTKQPTAGLTNLEGDSLFENAVKVYQDSLRHQTLNVTVRINNQLLGVLLDTPRDGSGDAQRLALQVLILSESVSVYDMSLDQALYIRVVNLDWLKTYASLDHLDPTALAEASAVARVETQRRMYESVLAFLQAKSITPEKLLSAMNDSSVNSSTKALFARLWELHGKATAQSIFRIDYWPVHQDAGLILISHGIKREQFPIEPASQTLEDDLKLKAVYPTLSDTRALDPRYINSGGNKTKDFWALKAAKMGGVEEDTFAPLRTDRSLAALGPKSPETLKALLAAQQKVDDVLQQRQNHQLKLTDSELAQVILTYRTTQDAIKKFLSTREGDRILIDLFLGAFNGASETAQYGFQSSDSRDIFTYLPSLMTLPADVLKDMGGETLRERLVEVALMEVGHQGLQKGEVTTYFQNCGDVGSLQEIYNRAEEMIYTIKNTRRRGEEGELLNNRLAALQDLKGQLHHEIDALSKGHSYVLHVGASRRRVNPVARSA